MQRTRSQANSAKRIRWVFTEQAADETGLEYLSVQELEEFRNAQACMLIGAIIDHVQLYCFQLESAPTTGQKHFQGYFELLNKKAFTWIQNHVYKFDYLAMAKGTPKQCWAYCTKQESRVEGPWTLGEPTAAESGAQKTNELFVAAIRKGATRRQLLEEYPSCYIRHSQMIDPIRYIEFAEDPPKRQEIYGDMNLEVYVLFGEPGTGKSRAVRDLYPDVYVVPIQNKGSFYLTQRGNLARVVLIEDFDGNMPLKDFNQRLDLYPIEAQVKHGFIWWMPKIIFLTTNTPPHLWYDYSTRQNVKAQVYRRITYCFDFNTPEGQLMRQGISCELLEHRYQAATMPMAQHQANLRMRNFTMYQFDPPN